MAVKKWFQRKKFASKDYTEEMLPSTRKTLFFDVMKLHWKSFLGYGLIFLLFCLPSHLVSLLQSVYIARLTAGGQLTAELQMEVLSFKNTMAFAQLPCILILFVGLAAFVRVIRQYAWGENVFFQHDFPTGLKNNLGQMSMLGILTGLIYALCVYVGNLALVAQDTAAKILYVLPLGTAALLGVPLVAYAIVLISIYQNSFFRILQMAFALTVKKLYKNWLTIVCCLSPLAVGLIPSFAVNVVFRFLYSVFAMVIFLVWYLYALEGIDKHINAHHYPNLVGKGLYKADHQEEIFYENDQ